MGKFSAAIQQRLGRLASPPGQHFGDGAGGDGRWCRALASSLPVDASRQPLGDSLPLLKSAERILKLTHLEARSMKEKTIDTKYTNPWQIGRYGWPDAYYNGLIDELHLYNRALSAEEALFMAGRTAPIHKAL